MRVLVLNNYSFQRVFKEIADGLKPAHHLYGVDFLQKEGYDVVLVPLNEEGSAKSGLLNKLSARFGYLFGDMEQQRACLKLLKKGDIIYAPCQTQTSFLSYLKFLGIIKNKIIVVAHHPPVKGKMAFLKKIFFNAEVKGNFAFPALSKKVADYINSLTSTPKSQTLTWGPEISYYDNYIIGSNPNDLGFFCAGRTGRDYGTMIKGAELSDTALSVYYLSREDRFSSANNNIKIKRLNKELDLSYDIALPLIARSRAVCIPLFDEKNINNLPWTESPFFKSELASSALSPSEKEFVKFYADNGYVTIDLSIDDEIMDQIKSDKKILSIDRTQDAWTYNESVKKIATLPIILEKLRLLYRREPIPFQTLNFREGSQQPTHSDMMHFNSIPERFMCGVWVALEDVDEDNGPLHYYPKSHKLPFYSMFDLGVKASESIKKKNVYMDYEDFYVDFIRDVAIQLGYKKEILKAKKGQAIIWAANLLHGGEKINKLERSRHSQVTHYYFEHCMYYSPVFSDIPIKKVELKDIRNILTGEIIKNEYLGEKIKDSNIKKATVAYNRMKSLARFPKILLAKMFDVKKK